MMPSVAYISGYYNEYPVGIYHLRVDDDVKPEDADWVKIARMEPKSRSIDYLQHLITHGRLEIPKRFSMDDIYAFKPESQHPDDEKDSKYYVCSNHIKEDELWVHEHNFFIACVEFNPPYKKHAHHELNHKWIIIGQVAHGRKYNIDEPIKQIEYGVLRELAQYDQDSVSRVFVWNLTSGKKDYVQLDLRKYKVPIVADLIETYGE